MWRQPPPCSAGARGRIECTYKIWAGRCVLLGCGPPPAVGRSSFGGLFPHHSSPFPAGRTHRPTRLSPFCGWQSPPFRIDLPPFCSPHSFPSGSCWGLIGHEALVGLIGWLPRSSFRPVNAQPLIGYGHSMHGQGPGQANIYASLTHHPIDHLCPNSPQTHSLNRQRIPSSFV